MGGHENKQSLCTASQADSTLLCKTLNSSWADGFFRFIPYDLHQLLSKSLPENGKKVFKLEMRHAHADLNDSSYT